MTKRTRKDESGQVLAIALVMLIVLATLVPLMVFYTQREALWTAKQAHNTDAFHLAEAGLEKGYLELSLSTQTWVTLMTGVSPAHYKFDDTFKDVNGGTYAISISSGPASQQATIIAVGRDSLQREVRALKAVYSNAPLGGIAIYGTGGAQLGGGVTVEWGAVVSPNNVNTNSLGYPQFWSAGQIQPYVTSPATLPHCDGPGCCQWHAYANNIPASPGIDLNFYKSSATSSTGCWSGGVGNSCYYNTDTSESSGGQTNGAPAYVDANLTLGSPGIAVVGSLLVMKNLTTTSGNFGKGSMAMPMPQQAWMQYCNAWSHYQSFDAGAPANFPGLNSSYLSASNITYSSSKLAVAGLLYVQGYMSTGGGGGNTDVYGAMYVVGTTTMTNNSGVTFYYNASAVQNLQLTQLTLTRTSWQDVLVPWPSSTP